MIKYMIFLGLLGAVAADHQHTALPKVQPDDFPVCANDTAIIKYIESVGTKTPPSSPVNVQMQLWIQSITEVSDITSDFTMEVYVSQTWRSPQISHDHLHPCKSNTTFPHKRLSEMWQPDITFVNSVAMEIQTSPRQNVFVLIYSNGTIWLNYRARIQTPCEINMANFPFDIQTCHLNIESYNYGSNSMTLSWSSAIFGPILMLNKPVLSNFELVNTSTDRQQMTYPAGKWDDLGATFRFERRAGFYVLHAYVPSYLIIFLAWLSFSMSSKATRCRSILCTFCVVAMGFQFGRLIPNLPNVSCITALDVWMFACATLIFGSIFEFGLVVYLSGKVKDQEVTSAQEISVPIPKSVAETMKSALTRKPTGADGVDMVATILLPALFLLFNIIYWCYYLA